MKEEEKGKKNRFKAFAIFHGVCAFRSVSHGSPYFDVGPPSTQLLLQYTYSILQNGRQIMPPSSRSQVHAREQWHSTEIKCSLDSLSCRIFQISLYLKMCLGLLKHPPQPTLSLTQLGNVNQLGAFLWYTSPSLWDHDTLCFLWVAYSITSDHAYCTTGWNKPFARRTF